MNLDSFAAQFNKIKHLIGNFPTPKARHIKEVVEKFERDGVHISPSGMTAEIVVKWLLASGQPVALYYHQEYKTWVVVKTTDDKIEAVSRG